LGDAQAPLTLDIHLDNLRLVGTLQGLYSYGSLLYRYSPLKGKDYLAAWLHHLTLNQLRPSTTYLLGSDQQLAFQAEDADPSLLQELLTLFLHGQQQPDAFFTEASWCYLQQKNPDKALDAAINTVQSSLDNGYEPEMALLLQHHPWQQHFDQAFIARCQRLSAPMQNAQHV
jgi:exodeoxyribonuclease V gamma subunit